MAGAARAPEHWCAEAGLRDVARLEIPADALRERTFEIYCRLVTAAYAGRADATQRLRVLVNGALQWDRTVRSSPDGPDSLDLRLRRTVPLGQPLRLAATCEVRGAARVSLDIVADED